MGNYYVFRINYGEHYKMIRSEILNGRLRQGWGAEGMDISASYENYKEAWYKVWGTEDASADYIKRKYGNLRMMLDMRQGDRIIVPKLSIDCEEGWTSFTILECTGEYNFDILGRDFRHIIPVKPIVSFSYGRDGDTRTVSQKFGAYRSAVNHVYAEGFQIAVERLIEIFHRNPEYAREKDKSVVGALYSQTAKARDEYLQKVVEDINKWMPRQFEQMIEELFERNGYELKRKNQYDRQGADIDLIFDAFPTNSFVGDLISMSEEEIPKMPEIRVQAKKKTDIDTNDLEGIEQLLKSQGREKAINILINTTLEFSSDAKNKAAENGIILINGLEFAALLVKYGFNIME